jgi:hypothetical protein
MVLRNLFEEGPKTREGIIGKSADNQGACDSVELTLEGVERESKKAMPMATSVKAIKHLDLLTEPIAESDLKIKSGR